MRLFRIIACCLFAIISYGPSTELSAWNYHEKQSPAADDHAVRRGQTGIRELVSADVRQRYESWKAEVLSTEYGRTQWNLYAERKDFLLTIAVADERKYGAGTGDFEWDDNGNLVAARITLGKNIDKGYPDPVYYPVMNSLATYDGVFQIDGEILASTKIIHEIEHVNTTAGSNATLFQRQNKLMASYNNIFLRNGYNIKDPRLIELADELGAKPIEIWENREYESEAAAMRYLVERINREWFFCSVMGRMKRNIADYARSYQDKFDAIAGSSGSACHN